MDEYGPIGVLHVDFMWRIVCVYSVVQYTRGSVSDVARRPSTRVSRLRWERINVCYTSPVGYSHFCWRIL